jgi:Tol biopolymer transport system component
VNAAGTGPGNGASPGAVMSADGRWIAFESLAGDLVADDTNGLSDVFLRDLRGGRTILVSRRADGTGSGNRASTAPQITPDGRFVLFLSKAGDLTPGDTNEYPDLFLYDAQARTLERASVVPETAAGSLLAQQGVMSADGRFVAFLATYGAGFATTLLGGTDVFLRDRAGGRTVLASEATRPTNFSRATAMALSADGRVVGFQADWRHVKIEGGVTASAVFFLRDVAAGVTRGAPIPAEMSGNTLLGLQGPTLSADGSRAAWSVAGQVYVWDAVARQHTLVSLAADGAGPAAAASTAARISPDGRHVWFLSQATNLTATPPPAGWQLYRRDLTAGTTLAVSAAASHGSDGDVVAWDATADQALAVFESTATGLVAGDFNGEPDLFARALTAEDFEAVSLADAAAQPAAPAATLMLARPNTGARSAAPLAAALSAAGRRLVYLAASHADESGELAGHSLRVTDLEAGTNVAVIRFPRTPETPTTLVSSPQLSADGRTLVFVAARDGLVPGDTNGLPDVFRHDLETGETALVSAYGAAQTLKRTVGEMALERRNGRVAFARWILDKGELWLREPDQPEARRLSTNGLFTSLSFSADGRWLSFACTGPVTPHVPIFAGSLRNNCYLYDLARGGFELVSQGGPNAPPWEPVVAATAGETPVVSADASRVAYVSMGSRTENNRHPYEIFLRDRVAARTLVLSMAPDGSAQSHSARNPGISRDGRRVVFTSPSTNLVAPGWTNLQVNVFVRHVDEAFTTLVNVNRDGTGPGNAPAPEAQLSPGGRFVVFRSTASDLVAGDTNGVADLFLRDLDAGVTHLLGRAADGTLPDGAAGAAVWSEDSRLVVFESHAANLPGGGVNPGRDLFVLRLAGPDTDGDGMDDDWEMAHFGTLERDGTGDQDGDGASDLAEFRAGTQPTNDGSVLRVLTLQPLGADTLTVLWKSEPGRRYVVQTRSTVTGGAWLTLPGTVVATGTTASRTVAATGGTQQFYRVLAVP